MSTILPSSNSTKISNDEKPEDIEDYDFENEHIDIEDIETIRKLYYHNHYPYLNLSKLLTKGQEQNFKYREFSFTINETIYLRYQSFLKYTDFRDRLERTNPDKIDIGAVYETVPKKDKLSSIALKPIERELIFDIDLTDYDEIRKCCSGTSVCNKCWLYLTFAIKVIDQTLRGRRGVHCWIFDTQATLLPPEARVAILRYLDWLSPTTKKINLGQVLHPSLSRHTDLVDEIFNSLLQLNQVFNSDLQTSQLGNFLDKGILASVENMVHHFVNENGSDNLNDQVIWTFVQKAQQEKLKSFRKQKTNFAYTSISNSLRDFKFFVLAPRLDSNVSIALNHLLKAPFCIHPSSRKISVPIDLTKLELFDIDQVPLDHQVVNSKGLVLKPYLKLFQEFVDRTCRELKQPDLQF